MPTRLVLQQVAHSMVIIKVGLVAMLGTAFLFFTGSVTGESSVNVLIVTTIIGFLTMIAQQWFNIARDKRNRQYDLEDRKAHLEEQRQALRESAALVVEQNKVGATMLRRVEQDAAASREKITALLEENTAATLEIKANIVP